ncbi:Protein AAR2-like protein [Smittium culicis]|uniref:Protein AAR2-like protein n=1 Tax=Smittium culicis TaxID=133412 RepID=A0A1R1YAS7_9FUNG|nr:Protein AAR2-like protein [Smittium culicis]
MPTNKTFTSATSSAYDIEEHKIAQNILSSIKNNEDLVSSKSQQVPFTTINIDHNNVLDQNINISGLKTEDEFQFNYIDLKLSFDKKASPEEISKYSVDKSWLLSESLKKYYKNDPKNMLGEMQASFLLLLIGHNFSGLEHWKRLILALNSESGNEESGNQKNSLDLAKEMQDLRAFFDSRFNYYLPTGAEILQDEEDDSDCAPVIVDI